jgi:glycosyltransferase involved in cell wall biosynthesis
MTSQNRYFICSRNRHPVEFDISNERPVTDAEITYFIRGFQILESLYGLNGYTVCFAWSSLVRLPQVGPNVIAVIYGDEHCRIPTYVNSVAIVIKCYGFFPNFVFRRRPLRLAQIEAAEFLRNMVLWLPNGWRWALSSLTRQRCLLVPVGYGLPTAVLPLAFEERPYITSFVGSVARHETGRRLRTIIGTPKFYCRNVLLRTLGQLKKRYGDSRIMLSETKGFQESLQATGRSYFDVLGHTKICVAPRGTAHETLRIYEALRFGCVVISDRLPAHRFYVNSPIIQIADWRDLPALIEELLSDPDRLQILHERSIQHYREALSEEALAARCASALGLAQNRGSENRVCESLEQVSHEC